MANIIFIHNDVVYKKIMKKTIKKLLIQIKIDKLFKNTSTTDSKKTYSDGMTRVLI